MPGETQAGRSVLVFVNQNTGRVVAHITAAEVLKAMAGVDVRACPICRRLDA
jgi:hypothetical protein